jgi:uncharacterized protein DUF1016
MKYAQLLTAIDSTSQDLLGRAAAAVNQALVIRNWLIGAYIVEFEQNGEDGARYGEKLIPKLVADLKARDISGLGLSTLKGTRLLYLTCPQLGQIGCSHFQGKAKATQIGQPVVGQTGREVLLTDLVPALIERISSVHCTRTSASRATGPSGSFSGRSARCFSSARAYPRTKPPYSAEHRARNRQPTSLIFSGIPTCSNSPGWVSAQNTPTATWRRLCSITSNSSSSHLTPAFASSPPEAYHRRHEARLH